jgi:predicted Rossmann fold nucleotide-binding protein DprA/Smf involved in DNA uptake
MSTTHLDFQTISPDSPAYPIGLKTCTAFRTLPTLHAIGNLDLLTQQPIGFFCSVKCPGDLILKTYDLAQALRDQAIPVISGFHSPIEQDCLTILQRGTQPIIHCYARSIHKIRLTAEQTQAIAQNRLLLLSPFSETYTRTSVELAAKRNEVVGTIAPATFLAYAAPNSKTYTFAQRLTAIHKSIITFTHDHNQHLIDLGSIAINGPEIGSIETLQGIRFSHTQSQGQ